MSRCPRLVPPAPQVLAHLFMEYVRNGKPVGLTFRQYLHAIGYTDPSADVDGMDDGARAWPNPEGGPALISVPHRPVRGPLRIIVLLVDFDDQPGARVADEYHDLLFSDRIFPTGSLRDFYREVSGGLVTVDGSVHGWFRMPENYSFYTNNESGMKLPSYPKNAQKMAEDAVRVALDAGIDFPATLDVLADGTVTGLFIVHAGRGAEQLSPAIRRRSIWSHKWNLREPVEVRSGLSAATYLTVPEDCRMGVCAHELGHLAFQWEDFYDPNGNQDGTTWAGSGQWDLMAGGSWNGGGARPAHPVGLHKSQHGWVTLQTITQTTPAITLPPYSPTGGTVVKVTSPAYAPTQFLLLENRRRTGFDDNLPGEGRLVWRVDLDRQMTAPMRPALQLVQADGRGDLEQSEVNQGDDGDPFPGSTGQTSVGDTGPVSTSFPDRRSGITLSNIAINALTGVVTFDLTIQPVPHPAVPESAMAAPAPASAPVANALDRLLSQPTVSPAELRPFVQAVTPTLLDLQQRVLAVEPGGPTSATEEAVPASGARRKGKKPAARGGKKPVPSPEAAALADPADFGGWWWRRYKANFGVQWDQKGEFKGRFTLEVRGTREYLYQPNATDPFRFVRANGEELQPRAMITDAGSVPRVAWLIPDIDPWTYIKAYMIHDWDFLSHHCTEGPDRTFEDVNLTLGEGIYTLMMDGEVSADWRKVELVYQAVSSFVGRRVWDRPWSRDECTVALPGP